jgi:hypothetical protein
MKLSFGYRINLRKICFWFLLAATGGLQASPGSGPNQDQRINPSGSSLSEQNHPNPSLAKVKEKEDLDSFEFIYVNANSGQSSGGHTAIKFGNWVYHFQYYPDKIFHIVREKWHDFRFAYNIHGNRSIWILKVHSGKSARTKLESGFTRKLLIQEKYLSQIQDIQKEKTWVRAKISNNWNHLGIDSFGYFHWEKNPEPSSDPAGLTSEFLNLGDSYQKLKTRIREEFGRTKVSREIQASKKSLRNLRPPKSFPITLPKEEGLEYPSEISLNIYEFRESIQNLGFWKALEMEANLRPGALIRTDLPLLDAEILHLREFRKFLEDQIIEEIGISSSISGQRLLHLLGMYLVISASLDQNKLIVLDCFGTDYQAIDATGNKLFQEMESQVRSARNKEWKSWIQDKSGDPINYFIRVQDLANRYREIERARTEKRVIRNSPNLMLPTKTGNFPKTWISHSYDESALSENWQEYFDHLENWENRFQKKLQELYPYNLVLKNCTTEIFDSIDQIDRWNQFQIQKDLGDRISPRISLALIPAIAHSRVASHYKIKGETEIPGYRIYKWKKESPGSGLDWLVANTTLGSKVYSKPPEDHNFIFFTDDTFALRPFFGLVNLGAGMTEMGIGIFTLPWDQGIKIQSGFESIFYSVPELIFFNIRKGSFPNVLASDLEEDFPDYKYRNNSEPHKDSQP